jgi:alkylglycerol monooxygenase
VNWINIAAALFGLAMVVLLIAEIWLHVARKRGYYRYADVVTNIQTAFLYQILGAAALGVIYLCYNWVFTHFAVVSQQVTSPLSWVAGFVLADFCHYWFHRSSHQNNFLWGIHQGHHTSEDFNLSTAVRKGIFQQWVDWPFFLPMAVLGYPFFEMFLPLKGLQFAYQFWLHNQFVGKIPYLEKVLVTPSAHRVHHGQNPQYIDKNHAGVFIIWDKLFGTFAEEKEKVVYGTTVAVNSFHPIGVQFVWWKDLWRDAMQTKSWRDRLAIPFKATGWRPADVADQPRENQIEDLSSFKPFDLPVTGKT